MATAFNTLSFSLLHSSPPPSSLFPPPSPSPPPPFRRVPFLRVSSADLTCRNYRTSFLTFCSSSSSPSESFSFRDDDDDDCEVPDNSRSKKPEVLLDLIQDIEPLDVSLIQKDVPPTTIDAMKRTISGMLGLLPSNQFQIMVEALWDPLSRLLVSSMMTGYTLRNAEYRLCLEKTLDTHEENNESSISEAFNFGLQEMLLDSVRRVQGPGASDKSSGALDTADNVFEDFNIEDFGEMNPEIQSYIHHLRSRLSSTKKDLKEIKRKNAALQMQQFVGEEKNELLDYLRSLQPEKVAELSEPTSPEVKEAIHSIVHGLLATLSPKMHSKAPPLSETPPLSEKNAAGSLNSGSEDCAELIENTSLNFKPIISLTRDYLARLLFWSMLLGHYIKGLEYRTQLKELFSLSLSPVDEDDAHGNEQVA